MPPKTDVLQMRIAPREKAALKRLAREAGMDLSSYVLARALPPVQLEWQQLVRALADDPQPSYRLAELHDLLASTAAVEFAVSVGDAPPPATASWVANYVAAMVEHRAAELGTRPPAWVRDVPALEQPWFATELRALRPHLLRASPVAFRRRNLFVDATVGARR